MRAAIVPAVVLALAAGLTGAKAPVPKDLPRDGLIAMITHDARGGSCLRVVRPDGTAVAELPAEKKAERWYDPRLSPDGTRAAYACPSNVPVRACQFAEVKLVVRDLSKPDAKPLLELAGVVGPDIAWADGKTLYLTEYDPEKVDQAREAGAILPFVVSALDVGTGKKTRLPALDGHNLVAPAPDGKAVLTYRFRPMPNGLETTAHIVELASGKVHDVPGVTSRPFGFGRDGKGVLAYHRADAARPRGALFTVDPATGRESVIDLGDDPHEVEEARFSPDGKQLLVRRTVERPGPEPGKPAVPAPGAGRLRHHVEVVEVRKADGSDPRVLFEAGPNGGASGCDWR